MDCPQISKHSAEAQNHRSEYRHLQPACPDDACCLRLADLRRMAYNDPIPTAFARPVGIPCAAPARTPRNPSLGAAVLQAGQRAALPEVRAHESRGYGVLPGLLGLLSGGVEPCGGSAGRESQVCLCLYHDKLAGDSPAFSEW